MKIHPRPHSLQEFAASLSVEHRALVKHLTRCMHCRGQLERIVDPHEGVLADRLAEVLPWPDGVEADYSQAISAAESRFLVHARRLAAERAEAPARLSELLEQPPERRAMLLRNHPRFRTWGLLERLIDHIQEQCIADPLAVEGLARLALSMADAVDGGYYGVERVQDMRARAWAYLGNARRIRFDLKEAEDAFEAAFSHLRQGTGDSMERALMLDLRASLYRGQRRFALAERLLLRAAHIYREVGEIHRVGRILVNLSAVYEQAGRPNQALPVLRDALDLIDGERDPRLLLIAYHNLITVLAETGRFMEAQGLLIQARPLYARFPESTNWRPWVAGRIARGLGQSREAEAHLRAARDGFLAEKAAAYDAALVSLELASLYVEQGRTGELTQVSEQLLAIFASRQIHREALAALAFLQQAAVAEQASLEMVTGVAAFLKRLQHDPSLSFKQPASL